jgi:GNAT superfamily N-acetyltransferase
MPTTTSLMLPNIPVVMARPDLDGIEDLPLRAGYRLRLFAPGDETAWARTTSAAGEFADDAGARAHFAKEFGPHLDEMPYRCLLLETMDGEPVGTTTAWRDPDFRGQDWGRIHWVAVTPPHQGRGLGRLLVVRALLLLRRWHTRAYLTTQTSSWIAIHLYLSLGFAPLVTAPEQEAGWALMREKAPHPRLGP